MMTGMSIGKVLKQLGAEKADGRIAVVKKHDRSTHWVESYFIMTLKNINADRVGWKAKLAAGQAFNMLTGGLGEGVSSGGFGMTSSIEQAVGPLGSAVGTAGGKFSGLSGMSSSGNAEMIKSWYKQTSTVEDDGAVRHNRSMMHLLKSAGQVVGAGVARVRIGDSAPYDAKLLLVDMTQWNSFLHWLSQGLHGNVGWSYRGKVGEDLETFTKSSG